MAKVRVRLLQVHRDRIVQTGADTGRAEFSLEPISFRMQHHVKMPHMAIAVSLNREVDVGVDQELCVYAGVPATRLQP